jgi:hypothetical protein
MERNTTPQITLSEFTKKYIDYFENDFGKTSEAYYRFFDNSTVPNECYQLGFEMDCGESFTKAFGNELWNTTEGLEEKIKETTDIKMLGSAVFSQWRYYNHWADSHPNDEVKEWFLILLRRLKELC